MGLALDMVLPKFSVYNCRLRQGMFWYYFEENGKKSPTVHEEHTYPCRYIDHFKMADAIIEGNQGEDASADFQEAAAADSIEEIVEVVEGDNN